MQGLVKLIMNNLYGVQLQTVVMESKFCKSEPRLNTECDDNVLDYWRLPNGNNVFKMKKNYGLDCDKDVQKTLRSHLAAFN